MYELNAQGMEKNLLVQDLSDEQLELVVGGCHQASHPEHHSSHDHGHAASTTIIIYEVNNYYIIGSSQTQITTISTGIANHSPSNNSVTNIALP